MTTVSMEYVHSKAVQAFGSVTAATTWLNSSNCLFGWNTPQDEVEQGNGAKVIDVLSRRQSLSGLA